MANEFVVKNGLIVSGSANIQNSLTAQAFTGSFSGSVAAPGAATQVVYNSKGNLTADSGFVYSGSYVGIGTSTPSQTLDVNGAIRNSGGMYFTYFGFNIWWINQGLGSFNIIKNYPSLSPTTAFSIDSSTEYVGIGLAAPYDATHKLHVSGTGRFTDSVQITGSLNVKGTGTTDATTSLRVDNANTSASLIVLDDGNVGVKTSSPTRTLDVNGNIGFNGELRHTSGEIITQYQESFSTPGQYFYLINPTGGGFGPDTVGINYSIFSYSGYGLEVGNNSLFHGNLDIDFGSNLRLFSGNLNISQGNINVTGSLNVTGSIYNNGVNVQSLSIAYAIALG